MIGKIRRRGNTPVIRQQTLRAVCLLWFSECLLLLASGSAQISPGLLSRPHRSLDGTANCAVCHKFGGQAALKCLSCHIEIGARLATHRGLHANYNIPPDSSQECAKCHSEHNGEDFPLIKWDIKTFDHRQTGYVLQGKHAGLSCNRCHTLERISAQERFRIKIKDLSRTYLGLSAACATCHQDPHKGRLGQSCQQCHNFSDWKSISVQQFDHSKTRYPLTGLHVGVKCAKCHTTGADNQPRYTGIPFGACSDCHADPHKGSFASTCQSCHNTGGWKKVSLQGVEERFDHSKTKFPLLGKHAAVDCVQCHAGGDFKKPLVFANCADCHKPNPHNGQFAGRPDKGECASCHTLNGWKPSTFTVKEHAASQYPLQGGHARLECAQCHIPKGKDTLFKIKFERCIDCHIDRHAAQFAGAPYFNACDRCHTVEAYRPSTFSLAEHKRTRFSLTGGHVAVPCADCHKQSTAFQPKPAAIYHWQDLSCKNCHEDPHKTQFRDRMQHKDSEGRIEGCEACHSTNSWKELSRFDHATTQFPLIGAHRATGCLGCHKPSTPGAKLSDVNFQAAPTRCEECHEDIHGKQFAKGEVTRCAECHNTMKWKPALFDHDARTEFPLRGAHQQVHCNECHKLIRSVAGKSVLFYKPTPKDCAACHGAKIPAAKKNQ